ncbi:PAB1, partial [Symbiodinium sp. KB8]
KDGVVIATEKKIPSVLIDEEHFDKIEYITDSIGAIYAGVGPDSRVLIRKAQKKAQAYYLTYGETIPVLQLVREIAAVMQEFTQSGGVRPFGVALLIAGFDEDGPQLYQVDPSGAYFGWRASAIGKNSTNAKTFLEKRYDEEMELEDAIHTALLTLREGFEGEMNGKNVELGIIDKSMKFKVLSAGEVEDYLEEAD